MKFSVSQIDINIAKILKNHGIQDGGPAQVFLESEILRQCIPYIPFDEGVLAGSGQPYPKPGGGYVKWGGPGAPYAHYQYMGVVYGPNIPIKDDQGNVVGWWSPPTKHPTGKHLQYSKEKNPLAGSHWVERMMADHADDIEKALADYTGAKPGGK